MYRIIIQHIVPKHITPLNAHLKCWATAALKTKTNTAELTIRIVDKKEITELNSRYRHKSNATNVLSFPFDMPEEVKMKIPLLGDIVICADVVNLEAKTQRKSSHAHWAHMIVHGTLHLLGYDHTNEADAILMETQEIIILNSLGFANPYQIN